VARLRKLRREHGDSGSTLVELLIAMILMGIVSAFVTAAMVDTHKLVRNVDDESQGLADVRNASERLARDLRDARGVLCNPSGTPQALITADPTCAYHLQLWIDYNADYVQESNEVVTWQLVPGAVSGQYNFTRTVNGASQIEAHTIVQQVAFTYDYPPGATTPAPGAAHTTTVNVNMTYDAVLAGGTKSRTVSFSGRLRNVS
jgi:Tfp pilus assembly protein PilW